MDPNQAKDAVVSSAKVAQLMQLVKDNQLATAAVLFILWQAGAFVEAAAYVGGVC